MMGPHTSIRSLDGDRHTVLVTEGPIRRRAGIPPVKVAVLLFRDFRGRLFFGRFPDVFMHVDVPRHLTSAIAAMMLDEIIVVAAENANKLSIASPTILEGWYFVSEYE